MKKKLLVLGLSMAGVLMLSNTAFAGEWKRNNVGWWYQESTGVKCYTNVVTVVANKI